jgi:hypothetical protein
MRRGGVLECKPLPGVNIATDERALGCERALQYIGFRYVQAAGYKVVL